MGFLDFVVNPINAGLDAIGNTVTKGKTGFGFGAGLKQTFPSVANLFSDAPQDDWDRQVAMQKEFAQNGISWKVQDAKNAGLHPLAALGAQGTSFSPVSVGSQSDSLSGLGQDVMRAYNATAPASERLLSKLQVERAGLENELLRSQIRRSNVGIGPSLPSNSGLSPNLLNGQGDSAYVTEKPAERTHSQPGVPAQEAGMINDYGFVRTPTGIAVVPSTDAKQRIEDQLIPELQWSVRNQLIPAFKGQPPPDPKFYPPPAGYDDWQWDPRYQEFRPIHRSPYSKEAMDHKRWLKGG